MGPLYERQKVSWVSLNKAPLHFKRPRIKLSTVLSLIKVRFKPLKATLKAPLLPSFFLQINFPPKSINLPQVNHHCSQFYLHWATQNTSSTWRIDCVSICPTPYLASESLADTFSNVAKDTSRTNGEARITPRRYHYSNNEEYLKALQEFDRVSSSLTPRGVNTLGEDTLGEETNRVRRRNTRSTTHRVRSRVHTRARTRARTRVRARDTPNPNSLRVRHRDTEIPWSLLFPYFFIIGHSVLMFYIAYYFFTLWRPYLSGGGRSFGAK